jgi:pimeloyl-ACP methyl ester carboxylesterase
MTLTARVQAWEAKGERVDTNGGHRVHVFERPGDPTPILLLHGFPSSSYDWRAMLEEPILERRRLLAFDFLGFGLSDKPPGTHYSLLGQADLAEELAERRLGADQPVLLVAHDMGTSVATELFAREIEGRGRLPIAGALLFNGSMLLHLAKPTIGQRVIRGRAGPLFARLTSATVFKQQLGSVFSASHPMTGAEAEDQWSLVRHLDGNRRAHELIAYMDERVRYAERWHGALRDWQGELSLLWGMQDPVARPEVLRGIQQLRPRVPVTELEDLGHYPQIEDPARVAAEIDAAVSRAA